MKVSNCDLLLAEWALGLRLAHPLFDAVVVEDVTSVAFELEHLVVLLEGLEADRARLLNVKCQVAERDALHLVYDVQASELLIALLHEVPQD